MRNKTNSYLYLLLFLVLNIFITLVLYKPYYGPMDDGRYLKLAESIYDLNDYFQVLYRIGLIQDLSDGFIRFTHLAIVLPLYFFRSPESLFILNAGLVFLIAFCLIYELTHILCNKFSRSFFTISCILFLIWPWSFDLFIYPSLQEKSVLFLLFISLNWFRNQAKKTNLTTWDYFISLIILIFAFTTKIHFLAFIPGLFVIFYQSFFTNYKFFRYLVFLCFTLSIPLLLVAINGSYTSQGFTSDFLDNFINSLGNIWILIALLIFLFSLISSQLSTSRLGTVAVSFFGLFTCIGIMLWGSYSYILSSLGIFLGCLTTNLLKILLYNFLYSSKLVYVNLQKVIVMGYIVLSLVCISWINYRSYTAFTSLKSIKVFLSSSTAQEIKNKAIFLPCEEARQHFNFYSEKILNREIFSSEFDSSTFILTSLRFCPYDTSGRVVWPISNYKNNWNLVYIS